MALEIPRGGAQRSGRAASDRSSSAFPAITIETADLPDDVLALLDQHLLDLGGAYSDPEAGDPVQYDELRIEHDQGDVEIVVYNRAICCSRLRASR